MKKIFLALAIFASLQVANAQVKSASAAKQSLDKAIENSQNPKKNAKASTWISLGKAYLDAYNAPIANVYVGASLQELKLIMGNEKPLSTEQVQTASGPMTKDTYADKNLYFTPQGKLQIIEVTKPVVENALDKGLEAYGKAYSIENKKNKDVLTGVQDIAKKYVDDAYSAYSLGNIKGANENFRKAVEASAQKPLEIIDTNSLYNQGFTAWTLGDNAQAKQCFEKCIEYNYFGEGGEVYSKLGDIATKEGDKAGAKSILEAGFQRFPGSQSILIGLINYYVTSGENTDQLFALLDAAKKNEPTNASLYYVEGNIRSQLGETQKAVEAYEKCATINPAYEFGYIGEGTMYYNQAIALQDKAQKELDDTKYQAIVKDFETALKSCIDPFEKAYNITKDDKVKVGVAEYLKNAYYRFRSESADNQAKYEKYDNVVKSGKPE
jgi:tetratricopeptide (TPR) repeat protein